MHTYITPVAESVALLNGFVASRSQTEVNEVDAKRQHLTEKFKQLAELTPPELAFEHLYASFDFSLPLVLLCDIFCVSQEIKVTPQIDGLLAIGIMSASLAAWKRFLPLATHKDQSEWLIKMASGMFANYFRTIPYFQDLKYSPSTLALVKA